MKDYPYTGYEYDRQKCRDFPYLGEYEEDKLPSSDHEWLMSKKANESSTYSL